MTGEIDKKEGFYPCSLCGKPTAEKDMCSTMACRDCHKSLSFEECVDGSWTKAQRHAAGMEP
jgi:hypothetical protein